MCPETPTAPQPRAPSGQSAAGPPDCKIFHRLRCNVIFKNSKIYKGQRGLQPGLPSAFHLIPTLCRARLGSLPRSRLPGAQQSAPPPLRVGAAEPSGARRDQPLPTSVLARLRASSSFSFSFPSPFRGGPGYPGRTLHPAAGPGLPGIQRVE